MPFALRAVALLAAWAVPAAALAAVPMKDGFPVTPRSGHFPLSEIRRGQTGVGYTVYDADKVEPFEVEVLGIMRGMLGPGRDVILAKLKGERIEFTGVISGMSGSPVYIDGRLVGAVAYRFGQFSREPIAGITPIADMLDTYGPEIDPGARTDRVEAPPLFRGALPVARFRSRTALPALDLPTRAVGPASVGATPITTPLSVSGLAPGALGDLRAQLSPHGFVTVAAGADDGGALDLGRFTPRPSDTRKVAANGPGEAGTVPAAPILPGSPIGALLMRGAINVAAIGTVTYVDGDRVLAFGHPFVGHGRVAFPMATAAILNTLASPAGSYKQGTPALEVGAIEQDRLTAIGGDLGKVAPMIPVEIVLQRFDQPTSAAGLTTRVEIVDDPIWLPLMLESAISSAGSKWMGYEAGGTVDLVARIHAADDRVLEFSDRLSAPPPLRLAAFAARDVATSVGMLVRNEIEVAKIRGVQVRLRVTPKVELTELESVTGPRIARAGETVEVKARLRPYRGEPVVRTLSLTIPKHAQGKVEVYVGGGLELDRRDGKARGARTPRTLDDLMALLAARRPAQALYARLYAPEPGLTDDMALLTGLPVSQRAAIVARPSPGLTAAEDVPGPETHLPFEEVVSGGRALTIRILP